jgi:lipoprotein-releasing system permease protein
VLGLLIALGLLWLQQETGFVHLDEDAYYMQTAVVKIDWQQIGMVAAGTLLVSVMVLLIPSFLVKKIQPIQAMRFS